MPRGFPKGAGASRREGDRRARLRARAPKWKYARRPFDPLTRRTRPTWPASRPATTARAPEPARISGVAPKAYIGNYKVLTIPDGGFGLNGNSAEIVAGIEAAVRDGMDVINLSLGEAEIEPEPRHRRPRARRRRCGRSRAGRRGRERLRRARRRLGHLAGQLRERDHSRRRERERPAIACFSSGGPTPLSLRMKPDVTAPGEDVLSSVPAAKGSGRASAGRAWRRRTSRARRPCCASAIAAGPSSRSSLRSS